MLTADYVYNTGIFLPYQEYKTRENLYDIF